MKRVAPYLVLIVLLVLTRMPAFVNAGAVNSDAAAVGLQAFRMLDGEWSRFIWGVNYQASLEAVLAAGAFSLFGTSALVLMLVPFVGYVIFVAVVHRLLRRVLDDRSALIASLVLVLTPHSLNGLSTVPPRQWSVTIFFLALAWADFAPQRTQLFGAGLLAALATFVDLYTLQMLPALLWFAAARGWDEAREAQREVRPEADRERFKRWTGPALAVCGVVVGLIVARLLRGDASQGVTELSGSITRNFNLLFNTCLAWLLSYRVFIPGAELYPVRWHPALPVRVAQFAGGCSFFFFLLYSAWLSLRSRDVPLRARRLGQFGAIVSAASIGGFLLSPKPSDLWAVRYVTPLLLCAPFTLVPLATLWGRRRFSWIVAPYLLVATVGGWVSWGTFVHGLMPVQTARGAANEEMEVARYLRTQGIHYGAAQYWLSYRMTFLFQGDPVIVPADPKEDRYPAYRAGFEQAKRRAWVFHPSEPRLTADQVLAQNPGMKVSRHEIAGFTVLVEER